MVVYIRLADSIRTTNKLPKGQGHPLCMRTRNLLARNRIDPSPSHYPMKFPSTDKTLKTNAINGRSEGNGNEENEGEPSNTLKVSKKAVCQRIADENVVNG
jgi:hypothetical protein